MEVLILQNNKKKQNSYATLIVVLLCYAFLSMWTGITFVIYDSISLYLITLIVAIGVITFRFDKKVVCYIVFTCCYALFSILLTRGGYGSIITFIMPILQFYILSKTNVSLSHEKVLSKFCFIMLIFFSLRSIPFRINFDASSEKSLINTNVYGMFTLYAFFIWNLYSKSVGYKKKSLYVCAFLLSVIAMLNFRSRGTLIALLAYVILTFLPIKLYTHQNILATFCLFLLIGIMFPIVYTLLYKYWSPNLRIMGKAIFTGREAIWINMFNAFGESPSGIIFGVGSKVELWEGNNLNVHNNFWNIIVNFGVVGFALYYGCIISIINKIAHKVSCPKVKNGLCMFVCASMILGITETTTLWMPISIFVMWGLSSAYREACRYKKRRIQSDT